MFATTGRPVTVFDPAGSPYHSFRIPAVIRVGDRLLAFCEGRRDSAADSGQIDVVQRISTDGGATWGPLRVVTHNDGFTCGNPAPVVDPGSGDVVLVTCRNGGDHVEKKLSRGNHPVWGRRVFVQRSPDAGDSWSAPVDVTDTVKPDDWGWYATGPCHGIALQHTHPGRLVIPCNSTRQATDDDDPERPYVSFGGSHCILSDDGGHTWRVGFIDRNDGLEMNANETTITELPDGRLYVNSRNHEGTLARTAPRVGAWSTDGGESLVAPYAPATVITAPIIQGSVLAHGDVVLLSVPSNPDKRQRMTIYRSTDAGASWREAHVVTEQLAGYSDLVDLGDRVGLLYETGAASSFATLEFTVLPESLSSKGIHS
ncbi:sialidase family protein [Propionibacteriaceae bacterium Y2011]